MEPKKTTKKGKLPRKGSKKSEGNGEEINPGLLLGDFVNGTPPHTKAPKVKRKGKKPSKISKKEEEEVDEMELGLDEDDETLDLQASERLLGAVSSLTEDREKSPERKVQAEPENEYHLPPVSEVTLEDLLAPLQGETRFSQEVKQLKALVEKEALPEPASEAKRGREEIVGNGWHANIWCHQSIASIDNNFLLQHSAQLKKIFKAFELTLPEAQRLAQRGKTGLMGSEMLPEGYHMLESSPSWRFNTAWVGALLASLVWLPLLVTRSAQPPRNRELPAVLATVEENSRPVIGILASDCGILYNCSSYIPASYVQLLQQGGAQVVPLYPGMEDDDFDHVLAHVNGVMTIGGFFKMNGKAEKHIQRIYDHAMAVASRGDVYPIWCTCVGIHDLVQLTTGRVYAEFLTRTFAENLALPLHFQAGTGHLLFDDELFPGSSAYRDWLQSHPITFHHHQWGITPDTFHNIKELREKFEIVATSVDRRNQSFVSLMQGRRHSIFASAFHPEKPAFEWGFHTHGLLQNTQIPHSHKAILANLHFGAAFVQQARRNFNRFKAEELPKRLIFNFPLFYTARFPELIRYFEESYMFF
eukprot:symbB.v1.2.023128.t1/scaffold2095.1/size89733/3